MTYFILSTFTILIFTAQAWADCAWVLIEQKKYPDQLLSDPYVSVMPHRYYETKKECEEWAEKTLTIEGMVKGNTLSKNMRSIERKDKNGREAYYTYGCIPSNVLSLFIKAEQ